MKREISAAVKFLSKLIRWHTNLSESHLQTFEKKLKELLEKRFCNHWHPDCPWKGQGYRCLRVNEFNRKESTIEEAAILSGLTYEDLKLPVELTIWVDPLEVCCRFGEQIGSCCTIASFDDGNKENFIENFDFNKLKFNDVSPAIDHESLNVLKERTVNCDLANPNMQENMQGAVKNFCMKTPNFRIPSNVLSNSQINNSVGGYKNLSPKPIFNGLSPGRNILNGSLSVSPSYAKNTTQWLNFSASNSFASPPPFMYSSSMRCTPVFYSKSVPDFTNKFRWSGQGLYPFERQTLISQRPLGRV